MTTACRPTFRLLPWLAATVLLFSSPAYAEDYSAITQLLKTGKPAQALAQIEERLASTPKDAQLRFLRGVAQSDSGQPKEAQQTFLQLTQDYPELPEPYNNLAVLYANDNQLDKARIALEMAIRTHPGYATAHENLGDVYAKLAGQAYGKALQLDASMGVSVKPKLALIRELFAHEVRKTSASPALLPLATTTTPNTAPNTASPSAKTAEPAPPASEPVAHKAPATEVTSAAHAADTLGMQQVASAIQSWASAWSARDMRSYLAAYSPQFRPTQGASRNAWEKERHQRIVGKTRIQVTISDLVITMQNNKAVARFHQAYSGDGLNINAHKRLELVQHQGNWTIVQEAVVG